MNKGDTHPANSFSESKDALTLSPLPHTNESNEHKILYGKSVISGILAVFL